MRGIVYTSHAVVPFDDERLVELATLAAQRNEELGVTGCLSFENDRFIQYIEGPHQPVTDLMASILRDPRHHVLHTLYDDQLKARRFPTWQMRWLRRSAYVAVEQLLADYISLMGALPAATDSWDHTVWRMVNTLSELRGKIAYSP